MSEDRNVPLKKKRKIWEDGRYINIIDGNILVSNEKLSGHFREMAAARNLLNINHFQRALVFFCCYRRAIYLNKTLNAIEVAKLVDKQYFRPQIKNVTINFGGNFYNLGHLSNVVFLTDSQQALIDRNEKCQLVFGPPGTGKTLILVVKLLKAMQEKFSNRLVVCTSDEYSAYSEKLKNIILVPSKPNRMPVFIGQRKFISTNDDVFCDEIGKKDIPFLIKRQTAVGRTFAVFTGAHIAGNYYNNKSAVEAMLGTYNIHYLETILRGTTSIVEYWKKEMEISSADFITGHGIKGPKVSVAQHYPIVRQTLAAVLDHVQSLLRNGAQAKHIAVIFDSEDEAKIATRFLLNNGIHGTSAVLQTVAQSAVVVDYYQNVYSMEWPFVIVCSLICTDFHEGFLLIASSRAIAHLAVISFDYHKMHQYVKNHFLQDILTRKLSGWEEVYKSTEASVCKYFKESSDRIPIGFSNDYFISVCQNVQCIIAVHRLNIVATPIESRPQPFQSCDRLTDCLQIIIQNPYWMQRFVTKYWDVFDKTSAVKHEKIIELFYNSTWQLLAHRQKPFHKYALKIESGSESFFLYRDLAKKFAAASILHLTESERPKAEAESMDMLEEKNCELMKELVCAMKPILISYIEYK